ncbi:MAG: S-methyl-5-thioribose-1-phosphate isomerase, partial [Crocosphaera sp.]
FSLENGGLIPIEERDNSELYQIGNTVIYPDGVDYYNPAFDVTPAHLITGIITEQTTVKPEDLINLKA